MERAVHLFHEARVQSWFLHWSPIVRVWNVYYGGLHFAVPIVALLVLWRRDRARYRFFRNVFGWMLLLGLVGFAVYPVTPPRLLARSYRFVDTGATVGGIVSRIRPITTMPDAAVSAATDQIAAGIPAASATTPVRTAPTANPRSRQKR